ncbi:MAG: hypothetical protein LBU87_02100 [Lactobacillales bacterium]|jgi:hypothetical protein|nr:hypothetical protein [Lactobacillales bacterium]
MTTNVFFAKKDKERLIAYKNAKNQNVFIMIGNSEYAPSIRDVLICDDSYNIKMVIKNAFELSIVQEKNMEIGIKTKHIWKPLLQRNIQKELDFDVPALYRAKRDLSILIQKLQEILLYIEPSEEGLKTYSHKLRELLILACTEIESSFKFYNLGKNERTSDYVKILELVDLTKYKISLIGYSNPYKCCPFADWNTAEPTKSIGWYNAYNQSKHSRESSFNLSTLENCINAISANIIVFAIRYSPQMLYNESDVCSNLVRGAIDFRIEDSDDFYIPIFEGQRSHSGVYTVPYNFKNGQKIENIYDIVNSLPMTKKEYKSSP